MGCGKTTLCRALHDATGIKVEDLDELIEERAGCSIRQFWAKHGEQQFRELEEETLRRIAQSPDEMVVACGGGTPCFGRNMEIMNKEGRTVWLNASHDVLLSRLIQAREQRPLIAAMNDEQLSRFITDELTRRTPYYSQAHHTFDSGNMETTEQIRQTTAQFIERFLTR